MAHKKTDDREATIRLFEEGDFDTWKPLWQMNMDDQVDDKITQTTWRRICNKKDTVFGMGLFENDELKGFLHYILHPTTGALNPVCYMQDLFVHPDHRRSGYAKDLLRTLVERGKLQRWERIYWIADNKNKQAQDLYKDIGVKIDFSFHVLPIKMAL